MHNLKIKIYFENSLLSENTLEIHNAFLNIFRKFP